MVKMLMSHFGKPVFNSWFQLLVLASDGNLYGGIWIESLSSDSGTSLNLAVVIIWRLNQQMGTLSLPLK